MPKTRTKTRIGEVRTLPVKQPWAWFIVNGYKDVENRSWKPAEARIGERFLVHASQRRLTKADFEKFIEIVQDLKLKRYPKSIDDFVYGSLLGSVVLDAIVRNSKSEWAGRGCFHWVISKARKSKPKKMKGQLGLYRVKG
jgi:hypothetical protein